MSTPKSKGGTNNTKDVIYVDVDDEITAIIDKVQDSQKKIVALVLPKRATVLQSIVNMKLLKRAASDAKKNLVLITSEHGLMPLAGSVGIHVAKSLNSRPEIPDAPPSMAEKADMAEEISEPEDAALDAHKTVGELSGMPVADDEEAIELDDEETKPADDAAPAKGGKPAKAKKFKIPNFNKFRIGLLLAAVGVVVLSMVGYAALAVWPEATITIKTDSQSVKSSAVLTLKTDAGAQLDVEKFVVPAQIQEVKKTLTQEAPATGELNKGTKATGKVDMTTQDCTPPYSVSAVPAGTGISSNGKTYITSEKADFSPTTFDFGTSCWNYKATGISITAQSGGSSFNTGSTTFTVAGRSGVSATGSASGGTDKVVKVVSQADIDGAKQKITEQDTLPIRQELETALVGRNLFPLSATLTVGEPETTVSAEANTEADTVTVTQIITYTLRGVKEEDLEKIVAADVGTRIDTKKQSILSYGLDDAYFAIQGMNGEDMTVSMQTTAVAGAALNIDDIKREVAGKKAGDARTLISAHPGVTEVAVDYSPFWVSAIPKKTDKITVVVQEPQVIADDASKSP